MKNVLLAINAEFYKAVHHRDNLLKKKDGYGIVCESVRPVKGHFRVAPSLCFKARLCVKPLIWKWDFIPTHWNKILRVLPFVKTDRQAPSRRNENFTFNQNYPARSVKYWIVCTKKMVFPQKLLKRPFHFQTDWSGNGPAGQFWQMDWAPLASFWKWVRVFGTRKLLVISFLYHENHSNWHIRRQRFSGGTLLWMR